MATTTIFTVVVHPQYTHDSTFLRLANSLPGKSLKEEIARFGTSPAGRTVKDLKLELQAKYAEEIRNNPLLVRWTESETLTAQSLEDLMQVVEQIDSRQTERLNEAIKLDREMKRNNNPSSPRKPRTIETEEVLPSFRPTEEIRPMTTNSPTEINIPGERFKPSRNLLRRKKIVPTRRRSRRGQNKPYVLNNLCELI